MARELVSRTRSEIEDEALRADLIEFIETIILYKVPRLTRAEIKTMLQLHDIRESRAYQEAMEEGEKKATALGDCENGSQENDCRRDCRTPGGGHRIGSSRVEGPIQRLKLHPSVNEQAMVPPHCNAFG